MTDPEPELTSGALRIGGAEIAYDICGTGEPLVLLHADIADRRMWDPQLDAFGARFQVVRLDLRGFGETVADDSPFRFHRDVDAVLEALGIGPAFLVGASLGGAVALDVALHHPHRVVGLVLIGTAVDGYRFEEQAVRDARSRIDELVAEGDLEAAAELQVELWVAGPTRLPGEIDDQLRERVRDWVMRSYDHAVGEEQDAPGGPTLERLDEITVPALVLVGTLDRPDIRRIADLLVDRLPMARRIGLAGVAHLPNLETPERVNRLILEFLDEVEAGAFPGRR